MTITCPFCRHVSWSDPDSSKTLACPCGARVEWWWITGLWIFHKPGESRAGIVG